MSKGNWRKYLAPGLIALAVVVALLSAWSIYRPYRLENDRSRSEAAEHDKQGPQKPLITECKLTGKAILVCTHMQPETEGADKHTKADLKAQQDAAEWSLLNVLISLGSLILSGGGLFYIAKSLEFTRKTVQSQIDSERGRLILYIDDNTFVAERTKKYFIRGNKVIFNLSCQNIGMTGAVLTDSVVYVTQDRNEHMYGAGVILYNKKYITPVIKPGGIFVIRKYIEMDNLFVSGYFEYMDIFKNTHRSYFAIACDFKNKSLRGNFDTPNDY